ncbi:MAG: HEAT repeat domain-containing protein [Deltaproteobacteria bacterium]|nr:HEAT repeat domain-containing protein [Deltaproteobacteria bacterium]
MSYLIEQLEELNYRVRVQAVESLEQIAVTASGTDLQTIVAAIVARLDDTNALVRYTAASTMVGLARSSLRAADLPSLIEKFEKLKEDGDADVRQLVTEGLPSLQARLEQLRAASGNGSGSSSAPQPTRFYVAVGQLGDGSGVGRDDFVTLARQFLLDELGRSAGVEPHGEIPAAQAFREELQRRNLLGFVVQGSVVSVTRSDNVISAVVSLLVLDQDQNLRVMLKGNGSAQRRSGSLTDAEVPSVQTDALRAAVRAAVGSLVGYLREQ